MGSEALSGFLGWTSIACWLGAQFPQVLENVRRQSCEGLALPFLLNWLLGDITNLVGCILTHQLPFQTILASYFCSVDLMLFSQFFYYRAKSKGALSDTHRPSAHPYSRLHRHASEQEHYRQLSTAAANVAAAAAYAASSEEAARHGGAVLRKWRSIDGLPGHQASLTHMEAAEAEDEVDEGALTTLADSFHSEGGRKRVSWSQERFIGGGGGGGHIGRGGSTSRTRQGAAALTMSPIVTKYASLPSPEIAHPQEFDAQWDSIGGRGRPLQRQLIDSPIEGLDMENQGVSYIRASRERKESRASRKSATLVFLGVWALFGIGSMATGGKPVVKEFRTGFVIERDTALSISLPDFRNNPIELIATPNAFTHNMTLKSMASDEPPSTERVIGRLFAWMCTTLYLTSRLPQIWKNFVRKSVEGLSMYLFVFAFLGNTFYVLSILTSPKLDLPRPEATAFLLESIPYLMGSGGTLLFDVTIVMQSFIYRPGRKPQHPHRSRSQSQAHSRSIPPQSHHPRGLSGHSRRGSTRLHWSGSSSGTVGPIPGMGRSGSLSSFTARAGAQQQYQRENYFSRSRSTSAIAASDASRDREEARALLGVDDLAESTHGSAQIYLDNDTQARRRREIGGADEDNDGSSL